jgi:orotate phosphoribosyltransferase
MTIEERSNSLAQLLLKAGAIGVSHNCPFILAAGWASPVYVDCRKLMDDPSTRAATVELIVDYIKTELVHTPIDAIVGGETAGIPFATLVAERLALRLRYVRKRPLGIGHHAQVEGGTVENLRVLLIDDLTTDGTSKTAFIRGLRTAGAVVNDVMTIFYHDAFVGAQERLTQAGVRLNAMATWTAVLSASHNIPTPDRLLIENFLADPPAWSLAHGGRARA